MNNEKSKPLIQVLERSLDIMEMLAESGTPMRSIDIAEKLGLRLQTVNNLLRTLYLRGYLSQDEHRNYRLGAQCFYIGSFADRWSALRKASKIPLQELSSVLEMGAFVGVIENDKLLCVSLIEYGGEQYDLPRQLWAHELHSTACGKLLLANLSEKERERLLARMSRRKLTPETVTDAAEIETMCQEIRRKGYAEAHGESAMGIHSAAVPIIGADGKLIGGVAVYSPTEQWDKISLAVKLEEMKLAAEKISKKYVRTNAL